MLSNTTILVTEMSFLKYITPIYKYMTLIITITTVEHKVGRQNK